MKARRVFMRLVRKTKQRQHIYLSSSKQTPSEEVQYLDACRVLPSLSWRINAKVAPPFAALAAWTWYCPLKRKSCRPSCSATSFETLGTCWAAKTTQQEIHIYISYLYRTPLIAFGWEKHSVSRNTKLFKDWRKRCLLSFFGTHPYNICFELKPKKHIFKYFKGLKLQSTASCNISLSSPLWCSWHQANPACWPRSNKQPHKAVLLLGDVFLSSGDHGFTMSFPFYSKLT